MKDWRRYDDVAETYARVRAPMSALVAADVVALADPKPGERILDVGTGTGVGAEAAMKAGGALVVGVDKSVPMLETGRRSNPALALAAAEAIQLPFRDMTFGVVLANFVMSEFTKYETALFDLLRVLKPGGRFAAATWATGADELSTTWRTLVEETVSRELVRSARHDAAPWSERFGNKDRLNETLRDAGLRQIRVERRTYRFGMSRDDYVTEQGTRSLGRFVRGMLGERGWGSFDTRARQVFATKFGDRVEDTRDVLLVVATKP